MPHNDTYRVTNPDSKETISLSLDHEPTEDEITKIFNERALTHETQKRSLAQADRASSLVAREPGNILPTVNLPVPQHAIDMAKTAAPTLGSALMMGVAPEFGLPLVGANLAKGIYDAYQKPSKENFGNIGEQLGYGLMGGVGGSNPKLLGTGEGPLVTPPSEAPPSPKLLGTSNENTFRMPPSSTLPDKSGITVEAPVKGSFVKKGVQGAQRYYKGESKGPIEKVETPKTSEIPQEQNLPDEHKWIKNLEDTVLMELHRGSPDAIKPYIEDVMKKRGIVLPTENN